MRAKSNLKLTQGKRMKGIAKTLVLSQKSMPNLASVSLPKVGAIFQMRLANARKRKKW
jgi:hypothetical protein